MCLQNDLEVCYKNQLFSGILTGRLVDYLSLCNLIMSRAKGFIFQLIDVTLTIASPIGIPQYMQCTDHLLTPFNCLAIQSVFLLRVKCSFVEINLCIVFQRINCSFEVNRFMYKGTSPNCLIYFSTN